MQLQNASVTTLQTNAANIDNKLITVHLVEQLTWLASVGGIDNISNLTLTIEFENGRLYDFEQRWGLDLGKLTGLKNYLEQCTMTIF